MNEPRQWPDPNQPASGYPPGTDPAYSGQYTGQYWPPAYGTYAGYGTPPTQPTEQLPPYWQPGMGYPPGPPPPPPPPKSPRWLWIAVGGAVILVAGLVLALVVVSSTSEDSTIVAPQTPPTSSPKSTVRVPAPTVPSTRIPRPTTATPAPGTETEIPGIPGQTTEIPAGAETVVYSVTGEGRAINITYVDTGGIMQTEFNVALPWSKEVKLAPPAKDSASVAIVNVGRDVTCSVTVNGAQVRQRSGRGLTICSGLG